LPANHQATVFEDGELPIQNLNLPDSMTPERQNRVVGLLGQFNRIQAERRGTNDELEARVRAYELAYRMQSTGREAVMLSAESAYTRRLYGLDESATSDFGTRCLLARRLVERGVRFVQVISGDIAGWDAHDGVDMTHVEMCKSIDKPVSGLLTDLKSRGLLDQTLVIWGGEFGRTPMTESTSGRDHNPYGFTMWMAGAGIKGGIAHGATDALGLRAEQDRVHVHDIHATVLHLLGLDHTELTFTHNGREERLTDTEGTVVRSILA
jgi:uncharacterized protein (DUF1501 family)